MKKKTVNVTNETGLHARPASEFTKVATSVPCDVYVEKDGRKVNAKSILGILSLAIGKGTVIDIITDGEDEESALEQLVSFVEELTD